MRAVVSGTAWEILGRLAGFWVWRRRFWARQLVGELRKAEAKLSAELSEKESQIKNKSKALADSTHACLKLKEEEAKLSSSLVAKEDELNALAGRYHELHEKYALMRSLLSSRAKPSEALERFKRALNEDYLLFANEESSLAEEAQAFLHLQGIEQELEIISRFPSLYGKSRIAISGGFSAGKTEFLNSLILDEKVRLPTGIETVTSIPTYVTCAEQTEIYGYAASGGRVAFQGDSLKLISHEYVASFGFEIRKLMPFLSVSVQLDPERFSHICLIDTPGYDPASANDTAEHDRVVAKRFAEGAQALLWVMGADSGQVSRSDIDFIESLSNFSDIPVYVVISKSEHRRDEIDDILDLVDLTFESTSINYLGVSAEDAIFRGEYGYRRMALDTFFSLYNRTSHIEKDICDKVEGVFARYIDAIESDIEKTQSLLGSLKSVDLDVFAEGDLALSQKVSDKLHDVSSKFKLGSLRKQKQQAQEISERMRNAVRDIFDEIS